MKLNIETVAMYVKNCGATSILQPFKTNKINVGELKVSKPDIFTPQIGKHKIPRFLYHFTNRKAYESMLKDGKIKFELKKDQMQGIFMVELSNLFKCWQENSKAWQDDNLSKLLLGRAKKGDSEIIVLKIPTANIDKKRLLIRNQNQYFIVKKTPEFEKLREQWAKTKEIPNGEFQHLFVGDKATNSKLYKQRKTAIEYIYPAEIGISKVEKIGEAELPEDFYQLPAKDIYSNLLKNTPEEKAIVLIKSPCEK